MNEYYTYVKTLTKKINLAKTYAELQDIKSECDFCIISEKNAKIDNIILFKNFISKLFTKKESELLSHEPQIKISMTKLCQSNLIDQIKMPKIKLKYPNICRNIGSIPGIMLSKYSKEVRGNITKEIFDIFARYSILLNLGTGDDYIAEYRTNLLKHFEVELAEITKMDVKVIFVGHGYYGSGFKITIDKNEFFYKAFYPFKYENDRDHGRNVEAQFAAYASKHCPRYFAKFFFGRVAGMYDYDTFIVTEYIAQKEKNKSNFFDDNSIYLYIQDSENTNVINNKIVDFGGLYESVPELKDNVVRRLFRVIKKYISYKYDNKTYTSTWKISKKQAKNLRDYYCKLELKQAYYKAVDIIKKQIHNFPKQLYEFLYDINNWKNNQDFIINESCNFKKAVSKNLDEISNLFKYYNIPMTTKSDPVEGYCETGYTIFRLSEVKIVYCVYDQQNEINEIKFMELEGDIYKPIVEIDDIINFNSFNEIENFVKS